MSNIVKIIFLILLSFFGYNSHSKTQQKASTAIINNLGEKIGKVTVTQGTEGIIINIKVKNLEPGYHGMHFHEKGNCLDVENFKNAAGHIMINNKPHGFLNKKGPHAGNLPNLIIQKDGSTEVEIYSQLLSLNGENDKPAILDDDGSALIIHQNRDDHKTQPIGNSGVRVACGKITKDK